VISGKAFGIYMYLVATNIPISADRLAEVFKDGRRGMLAALKELRTLGLIKTTTRRFGSNLITISEVVECYSGSAETALPLQQCKPNSQLANNPYSLITNCINSFANTRTEVREKEETKVLEVSMGGWDNLFSSENSIDKDEYLKESEKALRKSKEKYEEQKAQKVEKNNLYRSEIPVSQWKPKHVCQEFSNRIWTMHIKPWNVNASQFVKAMGNTRNKYGTNGEIEMQVMERFFLRIDLSKYSEPEHLWRLFLKMFPMLLSDARLGSIASRSIQESAEEEDDKYWTERGL
jgi:hypothetical protein